MSCVAAAAAVKVGLYGGHALCMTAFNASFISYGCVAPSQGIKIYCHGSMGALQLALDVLQMPRSLCE